MLHDLDKTLEKLIYQFSNMNRSDVDVSFELPNREWSSRINRPTINCYAFNMRENLKLRNMNMNPQRSDPRMSRTVMPPRRMDVSYLVTAWARKAEDEHRIIWRALSALKRFIEIPVDALEGDLRYSQNNIPLLVATEGEHPINLSDVWSVMDNDMRLGFVVVATIELDIATVIEAPLVLESFIRVGFAETPSDKAIDDLDVEITHPAQERRKRLGREVASEDNE